MKNIRDLNIFETYTRATFRQKFGEEPPPFDPSKPIKRWMDPKPAPSPEYTVFRDGRFELLKMSQGEAAALNLPGMTEYPAYAIPPTAAVMVSIIDGQTWPIPPETLSSAAEAAKLAADLKLSPDAVTENTYGGPYFIDYRGDSRRQHLIEVKGARYNVGALLKMRNVNGVNSPGMWGHSGAELAWVPLVEEVHAGDEKDAIPVPVRPLNKDERLRQTIAGWIIVPASEMTDREMLEAIYAAVVSRGE
jgi:hypothetical protein